MGLKDGDEADEATHGSGLAGRVERDALIVEAVDRGDAVEAVADRFAVSPDRVHQIVRLAERGAGPAISGELVPYAADEARSARLPVARIPQSVLDRTLSDSAQQLIIRGINPRTLKAYLGAMRWFRSWCVLRTRTWLPASENTAIQYIDEWRERPLHLGCQCSEHRPSPSALWIWYSALRFFHGIGDPPVPWESGVRLQLAMTAYCDEMVELGWRPTRVPRAFPADIRAMVDAVDADEELSAARRARDRAIILTNHYTGGRASDLCTYRIGDFEYFPSGIQFALAASKANKRKGRLIEYRTIHRNLAAPRYDGVAAVELWVAYLRELGVTTGALYRPIHKTGVLQRGAADAVGYKMDSTGMTHIIRAAAIRAGVPNGHLMTCHSLRRNRVQQLREAGRDTWDIEEELGWAHGGAIVAYFAEVDRQAPDAANASGML